MVVEELYKLYLQYPSVKTDTRTLEHGDIFFALKGPNFNGNQFAQQALEAGAAYVIVDEEQTIKDERIITVTDSLQALQDLAKYHRQQFNIPFIAITGSNGKTTTKELVNAVLSSHYITYTTQGNLNNHIGVPITILGIRKNAEMAVIEMGANHQGEIASYCSYTLPTHGIITNCGKAHLEGFGGVEGVRKGKGELFDFLRANEGTAIIFTDYDYLLQMSTGIKSLYSYGTKEGDITGETIASEPFLKVRVTKGLPVEEVTTQLVGGYNLPNVLCAVAVGKLFNVPGEKTRQAIESYTPSNSRSQMLQKDSNHIILDAYNANPSSMKAAIENFANIRSGKKILLLGAMMELGEESVPEHKNIISLLEEYDWAEVALVGGDYRHLKHPYHYFDNADEAKEWFRKKHFKDSYILIKGSRSMQMEKVLDGD